MSLLGVLGSILKTGATAGSTVAKGSIEVMETAAPAVSATAVETAATGASIAAKATEVAAGIEAGAANVSIAKNVLDIIPKISPTAPVTEMPGVKMLGDITVPSIESSNPLNQIPTVITEKPSPLPPETMQTNSPVQQLEDAANKMQVSQEPIQKTPGEELTTNEQNPVKGGEKSALEIKSEGSQPDEKTEEKKEGEEEKPKEEPLLTKEQKEAQAKQEEEANRLLTEIKMHYSEYLGLLQKQSQPETDDQQESKTANAVQIFLIGQTIGGLKQRILSLIAPFPITKKAIFMLELESLNVAALATTSSS